MDPDPELLLDDSNELGRTQRRIGFQPFPQEADDVVTELVGSPRTRSGWH